MCPINRGGSRRVPGTCRQRRLLLSLRLLSFKCQLLCKWFLLTLNLGGDGAGRREATLVCWLPTSQGSPDRHVLVAWTCNEMIWQESVSLSTWILQTPTMQIFEVQEKGLLFLESQRTLWKNLPVTRVFSFRQFYCMRSFVSAFNRFICQLLLSIHCLIFFFCFWNLQTFSHFVFLSLSGTKIACKFVFVVKEASKHVNI